AAPGPVAGRRGLRARRPDVVPDLRTAPALERAHTRAGRDTAGEARGRDGLAGSARHPRDLSDSAAAAYHRLVDDARGGLHEIGATDAELLQLEVERRHALDQRDERRARRDR